MGHFNFCCAICGDGGRDEGKLFNMPVHIDVPAKDGDIITLEGAYTGYGNVEVPFGAKMLTFYPVQFQEFWGYWDPKNAYVAEKMVCSECMDTDDLTSRADFDEKDFVTVSDFLEPEKKVEADAEAKKTDEAKAEAKPKKKAEKPKKLKKDELEKLVEEMTAELEMLRPLKERFASLEAEIKQLREDKNALAGILDTVRKAVY